MKHILPRMRKAFTLIEVNLAIFIMAAGVLGMVSLYSLGLRENSQSVEDVAATGFADAYLATLATGLSSTNMTWSNWRQAVPDDSSREDCNGLAPAGGWSAYVRKIDDDNDGKYETYLVQPGCNGIASGVANAILGQVPSEYKGSVPSVGDYYCALVATRRGATISLAFRASRRLETLMAQPVYCTDVHFQGKE